MTERLLMEGKLGELLPKIPGIEDPGEGFYMLYAPRDTVLLAEDMRVAVILSLREEDEQFLPEIARAKNLEPACDIRDVQNVLEVAREDKPDASIADLVKALNYYLHNDAFMDFSKE